MKFLISGVCLPATSLTEAEELAGSYWSKSTDTFVVTVKENIHYAILCFHDQYQH